jgi:hypothetical protein
LNESAIFTASVLNTVQKNQSYAISNTNNTVLYRKSLQYILF